MCGIVGIVDLEGTREIDRVVLKRMTDAVRHRGPDGEGFFIAPGVGFGHRRLAIIDKEGGAQPFKIASRRGVLNFNGEIYNYRELARLLAKQGVALSTRSDTEAFAEGLGLHGAAFVNELRGMFAFAYWDSGRRTLLLGRDRLGERPLYYAVTKDSFLLFASEIGALARSGMLDLEIDAEAVADYFLYGFIPDPKSIFRQIRKLPPATILTATRGETLRIDPYWRLAFDPVERLSFEAAQEELLQRLDDAVKAQMLADVPLGAFLSGGVDSSAVVASMVQSGQPVRTCSIGFEEGSHDERVYARIVAKQFDTEHIEDVAHLETSLLIDEIARVYGEPFADTSALPTYMVSKLARRHVTVALSGDGGDEIFAGYRRYPFFVNEEKLRAVAPLSIRQATFGAAGSIYPKLDWAPRAVRLKTTLQSLGSSRAVGYAHAMAANLPDRVRRILSPEFKRSLGDYRSEAVVEAAMADASGHPLAAAQRADLATWLPGRMLTKVDRASMAHGLEARPPLLDHQLVEWVARLDPSFKLQNGEGKRLLKAALERRLPKEILYRQKQGFGLPVAQWLRDENGPLTRLKRSPFWRDCGYLDARSVDALASAHRNGSADCSQELWTVIMFDAFLQHARDLAAGP